MKTVKGFRDFTGKEAEKIERIRKIIVKTFEEFGFEPALTPIIEEEKFVRGDNTDDEAVSDIFKLKDRGKRNLALRYEFTFQLKRLMKNKKLPWKRYQFGPVFRDEPVSKNRLRQFTQADIDIVGISEEVPAREESEVLAVVNKVLKEMGIKPEIWINNRALLNEILEFENVKEKDREQVLREIDKYDKLSEKEVWKNLKKYNAEKFLDDMRKGEEFFKQFESYKRVLELIDYCKQYGFRVKFSPTVVRGLSYYNGSVFEIKAKGIKDTIVAGGSYKFNGKQCTGLSFGLERLSEVVNFKEGKEKTLIISLNQDNKAIRLSQKLREKDIRTNLYYGKPSKALDYANAYGYSKVIFLGDEEVNKNKYKVKDMKTGKEKFVGF